LLAQLMTEMAQGGKDCSIHLRRPGVSGLPTLDFSDCVDGCQRDNLDQVVWVSLAGCVTHVSKERE